MKPSGSDCSCLWRRSVCSRLLQHGMSIGIGDTVADVATGAKIGAIIDAAKEDVQRIIEQYQVGEGTPQLFDGTHVLGSLCSLQG